MRDTLCHKPWFACTHPRTPGARTMVRDAARRQRLAQNHGSVPVHGQARSQNHGSESAHGPRPSTNHGWVAAKPWLQCSVCATVCTKPPFAVRNAHSRVHRTIVAVPHVAQPVAPNHSCSTARCNAVPANHSCCSTCAQARPPNHGCCSERAQDVPRRARRPHQNHSCCPACAQAVRTNYGCNSARCAGLPAKPRLLLECGDGSHRCCFGTAAAASCVRVTPPGQSGDCGHRACAPRHIRKCSTSWSEGNAFGFG